MELCERVVEVRKVSDRVMTLFFKMMCVACFVGMLHKMEEVYVCQIHGLRERKRGR